MFVICFTHFRDAKLPIVQQDICDMFFPQIVYNVALMEFLLLGSIPHGESIFFLIKNYLTRQAYKARLLQNNRNTSIARTTRSAR